MSIDARPTVAQPDEDPYLWLEEIEGARALAWVNEQNARTLRRFNHARCVADCDAMAAIFDHADNMPIISRRGVHVYNLWRDAANKRGLWRRTTLESFKAKQPDWEGLLDLDALARAESKDWQWAGEVTLPGQHELAMLRLSPGGGDAVIMREFDIARKAFPPGGFVVPLGKGSVKWLDRDHLLVASSAGAEMSTRSGYPRTVRLWCRGEAFERAQVVFETAAASMWVSMLVDRCAPGHRIAPRDVLRERVWFIEELNRFNVNIWLGDRGGARTKLDLPADVAVEIRDGWLAVMRRSSWTIGAATFAPDTILGISLERFLDGDRNFTVVFEPAARRVLKHFFWRDTFLVIAVLDDLKPVFEIVEPGPGGWSRTELQGLSGLGTVNVWPLDACGEEGDGELLASVEDTITPPRLMLIERGGAPVVLKKAPRTFSSDGLVMARHEAISTDGERIPYVQTGPRDESGNAPVHLYGYGGFGHTVLPEHSSALGKLWLERGGTAVIAQIRGGGEFGTRWHEVARHAGRRLAHDDFAAVAQDLVRRGVTRPGRIAAEGGSNGGLLITNMMVRYPDRFGALLCTIPLIDMRRYSKLLAGANWIAEYGDPQKPEDWSYLQSISAYHMAVPGIAYPPILLATMRKDDRVHPGHARKMAAKLQAMGYEAYFYEAATGGHGYGADNFQRAQFIALGYTFLRERIGWSLAAPAGS